MPETSTYRCLGHAFTVTTDRPGDHALVAAALAPFAVDADPLPPTRYELRARRDGEFRLHLDGAELRRSPDPGETLDVLLWDVGERAVLSETERVVLHAGAVTAPDGRALLLPGPSGAGKSTTTLGLVTAGLAYLSDEFAVIEPDSLQVLPFPRPLAIKPGTRRLLPHLDELGLRPRDGASATVHVPAESVGGRTATSPAAPAWVVFPDYRDGGPTRLEPLSAAETCAELVRCTFGAGTRPRTVLDVMADVARRCSGHRLRIGRLDAAVDLLAGLVRTPAGVRGDR